MIRSLKNTIEDHVKNIQGQAVIIEARSKEIKELKIELNVKSTQIANLTGNLQNIKKRREYQLRAIEKIKKSNEDKRLQILQKDALLDSQESQLRELKARLKGGETHFASPAGKIEKMNMEMQIKQLELQPQITKYLRERPEGQNEDVC